MKTISMILLLCVAALVISVQAADEGDFEQGKYLYLILISEKDSLLFCVCEYFFKNF